MTAPSTRAPRIRRAAIVGAGLAGLAAARELVAAGLEVVVVDKGRAPGGRTCSRGAATPDARTFDHGAQYFTVRDPRFAALVAPLRQAGVVVPWAGRIGTLEDGRVGPVRGETERLVAAPTMGALALALCDGLAVVRGARVDGLVAAPDGWRLDVEGAHVAGTFDAVILALPAPQALPLVAGLPTLAEALAPVRMAPCWTLMLGCDGPVDVALDGAFVGGSPLAWVARDSSKPGRPACESWVVQAGPGWSQAHFELAPEAARDALIAAFTAAVGRALPPIVHAVAHRWRYALTERPLGRPFAWDAVRRVGACGDWAEGGRVEGAWLSGHLLGRALVDAA